MQLQIGSSGDAVRKLEQSLADLHLYTGPADGIFGGGVESAVRAFQRSKNLTADGVVGPDTWNALFPAEEPPPAPVGDVRSRSLALTGCFETAVGPPNCYASLSGDFDGQGMSFGALQWNLGQGTLQPLFAELFRVHPQLMEGFFHEHAAELRGMLDLPRPDQLAWAQSIQDRRRHLILEPWRGLFAALGRTPECIAAEQQHAQPYFLAAENLFVKWDLRTERGFALMFDISVQNGGIGKKTGDLIQADIDQLPSSSGPLVQEVDKMRIIANRRADATSTAWREDVRQRKLTIANGEGKVHNVQWNLERQFGIRLMPA